MSIGRDGLVAKVIGSMAMKVIITVDDIAARFSRKVKVFRRAIPSRSPKTTIWGRVRQAADRASHAQKGNRRWANRMVAKTKTILITCVWPQTDMLNQTAGLNINNPEATRLQRLVN